MQQPFSGSIKRRSIATTGFVLLALMAAAGTALAASNTVGGGNAGVGVGDVSGFTISNVAYTTDFDKAEFGSNDVYGVTVEEVTFTIERDNSDVDVESNVTTQNADVWIQLYGEVKDPENPGFETPAFGDWQECSVVAGEALCEMGDFTELSVANLDELRVYAVDIPDAEPVV